MYGHSGEDTNPNFPSDKEKALHQYVDIDLQISHRHNVFHRTAELYAILIFVDMIKLAHASVYDSGELFVFIGSFIFIEFILAVFFKYHSRRLLALEKKNRAETGAAADYKDGLQSHLLVPDYLWYMHYLASSSVVLQTLFLNLCRNYPEILPDNIAAIGSTISNRNDLVIIFNPIWVYLFEFSVPSAGLAAAIGIMYNLLRAMTKPETMEYGLPFHLTYSLTMMVMLRFGTRDLNAALGQKILALRKEKDTKFRLAAFQRYMFHELRIPINALFLAIDLLHSHLQIEGDAPYSALDGGVLPSSRHPRDRTRTGHNAHHSCIQSNKVVREMMDLVTLHCKALKTLLDDSRYIRRLMSGQERLSLGVFNLRDVLSELFDAKRRDVFPKEIQIFCHIDSGVPSGLIVDGTRLYKILNACVDHASQKVCMDSDAHSITVDVEVVSICTQAEAEKGAGKGHEGDEPTPVFDPTLNKRDQTGIGYANANLANQSNTNNNNNHTNDGNSKSANGRNAPEEGAQPGNKVKPVFYYENNTNELFKASGEIFNIKVSVTAMKSFSSNQELSKVFEPFTADQSGRARGGESAKYHSHGMAMSIARQLVELHGGKMGIESSIYKGTTSWFELSLHRGDKVMVGKGDMKSSHGGSSVYRDAGVQLGQASKLSAAMYARDDIAKLDRHSANKFKIGIPNRQGTAIHLKTMTPNPASSAMGGKTHRSVDVDSRQSPSPTSIPLQSFSRIDSIDRFLEINSNSQLNIGSSIYSNFGKSSPDVVHTHSLIQASLAEIAMAENQKNQDRPFYSISGLSDAGGYRIAPPEKAHIHASGIGNNDDKGKGASTGSQLRHQIEETDKAKHSGDEDKRQLDSVAGDDNDKTLGRFKENDNKNSSGDEKKGKGSIDKRNQVSVDANARRHVADTDERDTKNSNNTEGTDAALEHKSESNDIAVEASGVNTGSKGNIIKEHGGVKSSSTEILNPQKNHGDSNKYNDTVSSIPNNLGNRDSSMLTRMNALGMNPMDMSVFTNYLHGNKAYIRGPLHNNMTHVIGNPVGGMNMGAMDMNAMNMNMMDNYVRGQIGGAHHSFHAHSMGGGMTGTNSNVSSMNSSAGSTTNMPGGLNNMSGLYKNIMPMSSLGSNMNTMGMHMINTMKNGHHHIYHNDHNINHSDYKKSNNHNYNNMNNSNINNINNNKKYNINSNSHINSNSNSNSHSNSNSNNNNNYHGNINNTNSDSIHNTNNYHNNNNNSNNINNKYNHNHYHNNNQNHDNSNHNNDNNYHFYNNKNSNRNNNHNHNHNHNHNNHANYNANHNHDQNQNHQNHSHYNDSNNYSTYQNINNNNNNNINNNNHYNNNNQNNNRSNININNNNNNNNNNHTTTTHSTTSNSTSSNNGNNSNSSTSTTNPTAAASNNDNHNSNHNSNDTNNTNNNTSTATSTNQTQNENMNNTNNNSNNKTNSNNYNNHNNNNNNYNYKDNGSSDNHIDSSADDTKKSHKNRTNDYDIVDNKDNMDNNINNDNASTSIHNFNDNCTDGTKDSRVKHQDSNSSTSDDINSSSDNSNTSTAGNDNGVSNNDNNHTNDVMSTAENDRGGDRSIVADHGSGQDNNTMSTSNDDKSNAILDRIISDDDDHIDGEDDDTTQTPPSMSSSSLTRYSDGDEESTEHA